MRRFAQSLKYILFFCGISSCFLMNVRAAPNTLDTLRVQNRTVCDELKNCWNDLFPEVTSLVTDGADVIQKYKKLAKERIKRSDLLEESREAKLDYRLEVLKSFLEECKKLFSALTRKDDRPLDVLVIGRGYDPDGRVFEQAGSYYYQQILRSRCGKFQQDPGKFADCKNSILILNEPGRERMMMFLSMLKSSDVGSFTFVGHGLKDRIVVGKKTLSRPPDPTTVLHREGWAESDDGALYSENMDDPAINETFRRVFNPDTAVTFYSCNSGQQFAGVFANVAGLEGVQASQSGMHFQQVGSGRKLVPDRANDWEQISPRPYSPPEEVRISGQALLYSPQDEAARGIFVSVAMGSGDEAMVTNENGSKSLLRFSREERKQLHNTMSKRSWLDPKGHLKAGIQAENLYQLLRDNDPLKKKLDRVINEALQYY